MEKVEKISVIMPTFNRACLITRAINSLITQTDPEWELLIIDDGSTDHTHEVVSAYLKDRRIKYSYKKNGGVGSARNVGVENAGEYLTFLDSDDEFLPDAISQMRSDISLLKENIGLILYGRVRVSKTKIYKEDLPNDIKINYEDFIEGKWPSIDTVQLCRKSIFEKQKFPIIPGGLESMLWLSVLESGFIALIRNYHATIYHTEHVDRLTGPGKQMLTRAEGMSALYDLFIKKFGRDYERLNPKRLSYFYIEKGVFEILSKKRTLGQNSLRIALKYNKSKLLIIFIIFAVSCMPHRNSAYLMRIGHSLKYLIK